MGADITWQRRFEAREKTQISIVWSDGRNMVDRDECECMFRQPP